MARPLGSGPIHIYIGFGPPAPPAGIALPSWAPYAVGPAQAEYYGTTMSGVDTDEDPQFYQVQNDLTGPKIAFDEGFAGREDHFVLLMSSINQAVDSSLEAMPTYGSAAADRGVVGVAELGSLMVSEGLTVGVWMVKAAAPKAVNGAAGMPLGRYYPTCILTGPNKKVEGLKMNLWQRVFKAKENIYGLNNGTLPLFFEDPVNGGFASLPAPTFG